ncbi:hypothetical protein DQ384_19945 [Sphaerisporangium album]|uniref:XRE family transcriptional regulator n=1 Tax=Sphaerisporangium album TaxID=509200 RepID=A0A367FG90_9ACTN|nr:hypothetical protein [Sphaerisporangium album]RCG29341.1 hypothetical protein DQ384_19945 [Sphaerisporangium album]
MSGHQTLLKALLLKRHQESHRAFCAEYEKVARSIDRSLIGSSPSREAFGRWLKGHLKTKPQADHCRVLERMFPGHAVAELLAPYDPGTNNSGVPQTPPNPREAATNRREVFQLGATTMALGLAESLWRGPDLFEQVLDSNNVGQARLLHLENEADRLGQKVPPANLLPDALLHLASVRELLTHRQPVEAQRRLIRVGAKLSIVIGEIMFCANHFPLARRWYAAAARAADEAGDRHLADLTLASSALMPTYSSEPRAVLAMLEPRLEQAVGATPALAWMWGLAALAHASLGDTMAFERAINRSRYTLDRCSVDTPRPGILSFQPERHVFYEARGRADLGDLEGTAEAVTRALSSCDSGDSNDPALVRFAYACALAQAGEIEEACRFATTAIRETSPGRSITVVVRAHEFDALLAPSGSATADWREALSDFRAPDPTTLPTLSSPRP